jgi:signal transduction histidine kinase
MRWLGVLGIAMALGILLIVAVIDARTIDALVATSRWVEHTHRVIETIDEVGASLGAARRARRAFLVSGDVENIAEYTTAAEATQAHLGHLRELVTDNAAQTARTGGLEVAVAARLGLMNADIAAKEAGVSLLTDPAAMQRTSEAGTRVDLAMAAMLEDERRLLVEREAATPPAPSAPPPEAWLLRRREAATDASVATTRRFLALGTALGFAMLIGAFVAMRRENVRRRASEAELRHAKDAAEASNRELEAFSYSVAHDLRAPLRGIDGFSQALLEDYLDKLDAEGVDHLHCIRDGAKRMGALIDDLLSLSRLTRSNFARERVDVGTMARTVAAQLLSADPSRAVALLIPDGLLADADPRLLRIALENLIGNAWKFSAKKPSAHIEVGSQDGAFYVRDDGAGFDMAYSSKLFGAFQRLHTVSEFAGTGIGLATVQRVMERHGGRVWAEGKVGVGATFFFTLEAGVARP